MWDSTESTEVSFLGTGKRVGQALRHVQRAASAADGGDVGAGKAAGAQQLGAVLGKHQQPHVQAGQRRNR